MRECITEEHFPCKFHGNCAENACMPKQHPPQEVVHLGCLPTGIPCASKVGLEQSTVLGRMTQELTDEAWWV